MIFNLNRSSAHTVRSVTNSEGVCVSLEVRRPRYSISYHRTGRSLSDLADPVKGELRSFLVNSKVKKILSGKSVLDLGCGGGEAVVELCSRNIFAIGVDLYLNEKQKRDPAFIRADAFSLPFQDSCFDLILSSYSIFHFEPLSELRVLFSEVSRALNPGGSILLTPVEDEARSLKIRSIAKAKGFIAVSCPVTKAIRVSSK